MPAPADPLPRPVPQSCQSLFHTCWDHLQDVHVRALAWLLDAPDLLDAHASRWEGKIATLAIDGASVRVWLSALDLAPAPLHDFLNLPGITRLGRYAEKLMAFYFLWCGTLVAHGLQVRAARHATIGEFDFLLRDAAGLMHYEFATKFYLFESPGGGDPAQYFIGPNLADTLDAKMDKILNRQLALAKHPAAQAYLPQPVAGAQALIKGWLFYQSHAFSLVPAGVAAGHCRGFWCSLAEFNALDADAFLILPRLAWLAPARVPAAQVLGRTAMLRYLETYFLSDSMPVMIALMQHDGTVAHEVSRGFIVPDDWRDRAQQRNQRAVLRLDGMGPNI